MESLPGALSSSFASQRQSDKVKMGKWDRVLCMLCEQGVDWKANLVVTDSETPIYGSEKVDLEASELEGGKTADTSVMCIGTENVAKSLAGERDSGDNDTVASEGAKSERGHSKTSTPLTVVLLNYHSSSKQASPQDTSPIQLHADELYPLAEDTASLRYTSSYISLRCPR